MKTLKVLGQADKWFITVIAILLLFCVGLLLFKLGSLLAGLGPTEQAASSAAVGWHGIWHDPLYLPIKLVRSVIFWLQPSHGHWLTRLPNTLFGLLSIVSFGWLIWLWHGSRTALLATLLFMTAAWSLHVSRLASFDVLYLWAVPTLLLCQFALHRYGDRAIIWYGNLLIWGLLLYIPGMVWFIVLQAYLQRELLTKAWAKFNWQRRTWSILAIVIWLPLLVADLWRSGELIRWLGWPADFPGLLHLLKNFLAVFVHIFIRGPQYPELWLARAPVMDVFTLTMCLVGIYFYAQHPKAARSRSLLSMFIVGTLLVALGGAVSFSVLIPLDYIVVATGLAYILHEWLKVFPINPLARGLGIGLIVLAVALSCLYNLRAYFIAWPHNLTTKATFRQDN